MSNFCSGQGRTRGLRSPQTGQEGLRMYAAAGNPRRTPRRTKRAIYGWTRVKQHLLRRRQPMTVEFKEDIKALFVKLEKIKDYL
jgi:hypothetical protein